jgi:replicative DNA helicase
MININHQIQRIAERYKTYENTNELKEDIQYLLSELKTLEDIESVNPVSIGKLVGERLKQYGNLNEIEKLFIETGFKEFDFAFGGLLKGELVVIGGRPGMGKSQFIVNLCANIAKQGRPCAFINLEMSSFLLANRFISLFSKLPGDRLLKGDVYPEDAKAIVDASLVLEQLPIYTYDQYTNSIFNIVDRCKKLVQENKVEVIFIDYVQLIGNYNRRHNREMELASVARELKKLAKELNVCVVVTSQLSRQVENRPGGSKRPQLSDLRESGAIEQDADKVVFLYRAEYYGIEFDENNDPTRNAMEVIMAKNKTGPLETIKLTAEKGFTGFREYKGPYSEIQISDDRLNELN